MIEVIDAQPYHCGRLARDLRPGHRDLMVKMGVRVHREIADRFNDSAWRKAMLINGVLVALGGVTGTLASGAGLVWLAIGAAAEGHANAVAREGLRQMDDLLSTRTQIGTLIMADDKPSIAFAYFLGFRVEERTVVNGADAMVMVRTKSAERAA